jgi:hypothetical protein
MAKVKTTVSPKLTQKYKKTKTELFKIALTPINYGIIGLGILIIIIGYIFMSQGTVEGFLPTVIAPILLVLGYCIIIPIGILVKTKTVEDENVPKNKTVNDFFTKDKGVTASNIKTN